jgi:hypothetical protein
MMISRIVLALALSAIFSVAITGEVLADEAEELWYYDGCQEAEIACTASYSSTLYVNGLSVGACTAAPSTIAVSTRPYLTNTLTLISDSSFTYELTATCTATMTAPTPITGTAILPTPEVPSDTMGMSSVLGGGGFLGISFGGSLSDPGAPINIWLGHAEDFVDIINTGNILYIIGAVAGAGAVLSWAINKVKNPGM